MRLCWRLSSMPELSHLSEPDRRALLRRAVNLDARVRMVVQPLFLSLVIAGMTSAAVHVVLNRRYPEVTIFLFGTTWPVLFVVLYQFLLLRIRVHVRLEVMRGFEGRQLPVCLKCGYDLKGLAESKCPECGARIIVPPARRE